MLFRSHAKRRKTPASPATHEDYIMPLKAPSRPAVRRRGCNEIFMQGQRYPPGSCACICACRRDHESWPGGESRRRDLNRSLAAGLQALPGPPSSLRSSPTGFFRRPPSHECRLRRLTNAPLRGCTNSDSRAVGFVKRFVDIRVPRRRRS